MPFLVSCLPSGLPIDTGNVFSTLPLRLTVIWCVLSSMVATSDSPVRKLDLAPLASMRTVVLAGQKSIGRQRTWVSLIQ